MKKYIVSCGLLLLATFNIMGCTSTVHDDIARGLQGLKDKAITTYKTQVKQVPTLLEELKIRDIAKSVACLYVPQWARGQNPSDQEINEAITRQAAAFFIPASWRATIRADIHKLLSDVRKNGLEGINALEAACLTP